MDPLNLPTYSFSVKSEEGRSLIFDPIRRKYVVLTPEEWVRQHFVNYLVDHLGFPASLIALEKEFSFNRMKKRTDIMAYNSAGEALLMVECKAPEVRINQKVFDQAGLYNLNFEVPCIIISNGKKHYCARYSGKSYEFEDHIPDWNELQSW